MIAYNISNNGLLISIEEHRCIKEVKVDAQTNIVVTLSISGVNALNFETLSIGKAYTK